MQPKYISGLLASAATRRIDHLRAEEKMIQRERELEGDEFKDNIYAQTIFRLPS